MGAPSGVEGLDLADTVHGACDTIVVRPDAVVTTPRSFTAGRHVHVFAHDTFLSSVNVAARYA